MILLKPFFQTLKFMSKKKSENTENTEQTETTTKTPTPAQTKTCEHCGQTIYTHELCPCRPRSDKYSF